MMKVTWFILFIVFLVGCHNQVDYVSLGINDEYAVNRMKKLILHPEYSGDSYAWLLNDSLVSSERDYIFCQPYAGTYILELKISNGDKIFKHKITIVVWEEEVSYRPYITKVYEYCPAPGQFINTLPQIDNTDDYVHVLKKVEDCITDNKAMLISLGGYGGYVTFGFDHSVCNVSGEYDFRLYGNAFVASSKTDNRLGGSCEPGIVMVSIDKNQNGIPDDVWYELVGSEYNNLATIHNYRITYYRPLQGHVPTPFYEGSVLIDTSYIRWRDNMGKSGYIVRLSYHQQDYFPIWIKEDSISFSGTLLPPNAVDEAGDGSYYVLYAHGWGYADNAPNDSARLNSFNIDWAVDSTGKHVYLPCIDFVRVYTGVNQQCGWLGETSTELSKAEDLHVIDYFNN